MAKLKKLMRLEFGTGVMMSFFTDVNVTLVCNEGGDYSLSTSFFEEETLPDGKNRHIERIKEKSLSAQEGDKLLGDLRLLGVFDWESDYGDPENIQEDTQPWGLDLTYEDGSLESHYGIYPYPEHFREFLEVLGAAAGYDLVACFNNLN
ncbi:MAG: hypothetical protein ACOYCA_04310 [Eggerthellaceae bacterium]|jgi:hypothetical protein